MKLSAPSLRGVHRPETLDNYWISERGGPLNKGVVGDVRGVLCRSDGSVRRSMV